MQRAKGCLKIFVITIVAIIVVIILWFVIWSTIENRKYDDWYVNFKDCPPPANSVVIKTDRNEGKVNNGNSDDYDYGIYWIIETSLSKEEVTAYYDKIVLESNKNVIGYDCYLFVHNMPDNNYYIFNDIREYMETFDSSQYSKNIFIVYVLKPGRHFLRN